MAGMLFCARDGLASRVLPPRAAEVLSRSFQSLDPSWRLAEAAIEQSRVRVTLCPVPSGECLEVQLTDPDDGCPEEDRLGVWCLHLPAGDTSRFLRVVLEPVLSPRPAEPLWVSPEGEGAVEEVRGEGVPEPASGGGASRWWATLGLLALWTAVFLPGFLAALGSRRFRRVQEHRLRAAALVTVAWIALAVGGMNLVPWRFWGGLLGVISSTWVGFLSGLAWPQASPFRAIRRLGWLWGILLIHGLVLEGLVEPATPAGPGAGVVRGNDRTAMLGTMCGALFPEEPPSLESYREMRLSLRREPPPSLWLHLGGDVVTQEPAGVPLPALVGSLRPGEAHWNGGLPGTATDVHVRQALAWTLREPRPAGVVLYLAPDRDVSAIGERNACCGAAPLFAFPEGEPRPTCERLDPQGQWRVLLGQTPPPRVLESLEDSRLVGRIERVWQGAFGRLLAGRDDRAAALSRLRFLLPWLMQRLQERGVRLLLVVVPSPRELGSPADGESGSREWVQVMEMCRVLDLPCRDAREAWVASSEKRGGVAPFLPGTASLSPAGEQQLARWVAEHLASLEDSRE